MYLQVLQMSALRRPTEEIAMFVLTIIQKLFCITSGAHEQQHQTKANMCLAVPFEPGLIWQCSYAFAIAGHSNNCR